MSVLGWFPRAWTRSFTRPLCATTFAYGSDCRHCAGSAVAVRLNVVFDISCRGAVPDSHGPFYHRDSPATVH